MLLGLLAGLLIYLGWAQPWSSKDKRYWSVGLGLVFLGGGLLANLAPTPAMKIGFGLAAGSTMFAIGAIIDLVRHFHLKGKEQTKPALEQSVSADKSGASPSNDQAASDVDHYEVLGVSPEAEAEVIDAAYKAMIRKHESDTKRVRTIIEAYEVLKDPAQRASYESDRKRSIGSKAAAPAMQKSGLETATLETHSDTPTAPVHTESKASLDAAESRERGLAIALAVGLVVILIVFFSIQSSQRAASETSPGTEAAPVSDEVKAAIDAKNKARNVSILARAAAERGRNRECPNRSVVWSDCYGWATNATNPNERYEGYFFNDTYSGLGVYVWEDGARYEGRFHRGERSGHGVLIMPDGTRYEGYWEGGKLVGYGVESANGTESYGYYEDGKLLRAIQ